MIERNMKRRESLKAVNANSQNYTITMDPNPYTTEKNTNFAKSLQLPKDVQIKWFGNFFIFMWVLFTLYLFCIGLYSFLSSNSSNLTTQRKNMLITNLKGISSLSSTKSSKLDSDSELDSAGDVSSDGGGEYIDIPIVLDGVQGQNAKIEEDKE